MDNGGGTGNPDRFRKIKDCFMEEVLSKLRPYIWV